MPNTYLETNGFYLGRLQEYRGSGSDLEGVEITGSVLESRIEQFWTATDSSTAGQPPSGAPSGRINTNWEGGSNQTYPEDSDFDYNNVDVGEAIGFEGTWRRITNIERYTATFTTVDRQEVTGQLIIVTDGSDRKYLVLNDRVADDIADTNSNLGKITINNFLSQIEVQNRYNQANFSNEYDFGINCFTDGTLISTDRGEIKVEELAVGDQVLTIDHGYQPVKWVGRSEVGEGGIRMEDRFRPILITAGALGSGLPRQDLRVSPQHRVLVGSDIVPRMFGVDEVLVAAKHLVGAPGISVDAETSHVNYYQVLFDGHEVIYSNGAPTESLYLGQEAQKALTPDGLEEVQKLFPELKADAERGALKAARQFVKGSRGRKMTERHYKNGKPLLGTSRYA